MSRLKNVGPDWPLEEPYPLSKLRALIETLEMSEKSVFKRHIHSHSANNHESKYIRLFDCVNDCLLELERTPQKAPADGVKKSVAEGFYAKFKARYLLRKIGGYAELGPMAIYLYNRILDALRFQNTDSSQRLELYSRLLDIQLLMRKGLQRECLDMIHDTKKLATELEAMPQLFDLLQIEFRLYFNSKNNQTVTQLRSFYETGKKWLQQLETIIRLRDLRYELQLVLWGTGNTADDPELRAKLDHFIEYVRRNPPRETFEEEFNFQTTLAHLIWIEQKNPSGLLRPFLNENYPGSVADHFKAIIELYDRYPERKKEDPRHYRDNLFNYLGIALAHKTDVRMEDYAYELARIPSHDPDFLRSVVYIRLIDFTVRKDFPAAKEFLYSHQVWELSERPNNQVSTSRLQIIRYLAGVVFFFLGEYLVAAQWFAANLHKTDQPINADAQGASALYHLLARFELGFASKLIYRVLLQPLHDYLPDEDPLVRKIIGTMEKILQAGKDEAALQAIAEKAMPEIQAEMTDGSLYTLFLGWLESKRLQRPILETIDAFI